jgi:hypothetical protein
MNKTNEIVNFSDIANIAEKISKYQTKFEDLEMKRANERGSVAQYQPAEYLAWAIEEYLVKDKEIAIFKRPL